MALTRSSPRRRDAQKARCYAAENAAFDGLKAPPLSWDQTRAFVDRVFRSKWMEQRYPHAARRWRLNCIRLGKGREGTRALAGPGGITLPGWSRQPAIILHEIGHVLAPVASRHDHEWAAIYLKLVSRFMGKENHDRLRSSFREHRVRYTPPRKGRTLTPEQRAELVARLQRYRAQRAEEAA